LIPATIRRLALPVSRISGVQRLFRLRSRGPTVLFYHGVEEKIVDPEIQWVHTLLGVFERQIAFLRRQREVISLDDLYECLVSGKRLEPRHIVLTFDDGYKNNLGIVAPLLQSWNLPFTIFVSTRHISERRRFPWYFIRVAMLYAEKRQIHFESIQKSFDLSTHEKRVTAARSIIATAKKAPLNLTENLAKECMDQLAPERWAELNARFMSEEPMDWDDVRRTQSMGATIASHCHDHCILHSKQSEQEVYRQLNESKAAIEKKAADCKYFAYPNGTADDISGVAYAAVKSAQFRMAFTTVRGEITPDCDCLVAPRIFALPDYEEFCYLVNRSSRQNEIYRTTRWQWQSKVSADQPMVLANSEGETS
jgi:peptidoglycan/xylan/chitin deacetylase (PgdA/CDA1 family)